MFQITPQAFSLDISDNSLKIALLKKKGRNLSLESFSQIILPPGLVQQGDIVNPDEIANWIKKAITQVEGRRIKTKYVLTSLPEERSFVQVIPLPPMKSQEINNALQWEIEAHIPLKSDEVFLDWQLVEPYNKKAKQIYVLIAATPQNIVTNYVRALDMAGLLPLALEVASISTARSLIEKGKSQNPTAILDLGIDRTAFLLYSGKTLCFTANIPLGSQHLTQAISEKMSVDLNTAENLKTKVGLDEKKGKEILQSCQPILDQIITETQKYISFFQHQCPLDYAPCESVKKVLICGGGAQLFGLSAYLSLGLKIPAELANPWINILKPPLKSVPKLSFTESLGFSTCLGLALGGLELIP
ncbi:MAG: hypothetical protein COY09_03120 [Candidatus Portnoybacteria bacterium CG_4_10_14_0_2_um_filter_39_11]|uniref:SHS2 domain-containing protein n=1 Tax=Candidatus Portnoybacteria bacterium CG_4_10_14_0_2_um_filter_39_11 TaxID=1974797 RepID=A0A2M7UGM8_9BACT|nr:MAG: hypothetical protein COY09_03120 [Candidatus Portnoybacteria bacterium CG_4_10_14_0_2_um_filter_39_11]